MWRRLYLRADAFLRFTQRKDFLTTLMGEDTINPEEEEEEEFEEIYVEVEEIYVDPERPSQKTNVHRRVIYFQGEKYVVGKELPEGKGAADKKKHTHDRLTCQHPLEQMLGGGGRAEQKWWCCQACGTRWERVLSSSYEGNKTSLHGSDLMTFGKHTGKTYITVHLLHPDYCDWALRTAESGNDSSPALLRFAKYLATTQVRRPENAPAGRMDEEP